MLDTLSSAPHYRAHLLPLWDALPGEVRGHRIDLDVDRGPETRHGAVLVASWRDMGWAVRRGYQRIALLEHGIGQSYIGSNNGSYPGGRGREYVSLFLSPNEHAASRDRAAYPSARVEVVGDPRLDTVPHKAGFNLSPANMLLLSPSLVVQPTICVSFHWDWSHIPETHSAFAAYKNALPALRERFHVIGHCHPKAVEAVTPWYRKLGIRYVADFDDVCRQADVYVAENTSTLYEFASTGRPVVVLNLPEYRRDVEHGLRFWAAANVGIQVDDPRRLADAVEEAGQRDDFRSFTYARGQWPDWDREAALNIVYAVRTNVAAAAAAVVMDWLAEPAKAVA